MHRRGFVQKKILPHFGFYPWECPVCRETLYLRKRDKGREQVPGGRDGASWRRNQAIS
jgi:hypothetical protein